jgi:hypothetical protein
MIHQTAPSDMTVTALFELVLDAFGAESVMVGPPAPDTAVTKHWLLAVPVLVRLMM